MSQTDEKQHYTAGITRARWMVIGLACASLIVGIIGTRYANNDPSIPQQPPSHRIEYQVTGSSDSVKITYLNDMAYTEERSGAPPWRFGFRATQGRDLRVEIENEQSSGTIGCIITASGETIYSVAETNDARIVCQAQVP
jgi:hypothetical protein